MTDDNFPRPAAESEALSAYLGGDMEGPEAAAFEDRLADEPELRAQLDALADALVRLGGFDDAVLPQGFDDRLAARLDAERDEVPTAPVDLNAARARRADRSKLWLGIGTAAAVVAIGAVMGTAAIRGMSAGGQDTAAQEESAAGAGAGAGDSAASESAGAGRDDAGRPQAPVLLDEEVALADEDAVSGRYSAVPEAEGLIGAPLEEARRLETRFTRAVARRRKPAVVSVPGAVQSAPMQARGNDGGAAQGEDGEGSDKSEDMAAEEAPPEAAAAPPPAPLRGDPCLTAIREDAKAPLVPVRVESVRYQGRRAVAYVFVTASPGSSALDRTEVWVVQPRSCATLLFQQY